MIPSCSPSLEISLTSFSRICSFTACSLPSIKVHPHRIKSKQKKMRRKRTSPYISFPRLLTRHRKRQGEWRKSRCFVFLIYYALLPTVVKRYASFEPGNNSRLWIKMQILLKKRSRDSRGRTYAYCSLTLFIKRNAFVQCLSDLLSGGIVAALE